MRDFDPMKTTVDCIWSSEAYLTGINSSVYAKGNINGTRVLTCDCIFGSNMDSEACLGVYISLDNIMGSTVARPFNYPNPGMNKML